MTRKVCNRKDGKTCFDCIEFLELPERAADGCPLWGYCIEICYNVMPKWAACNKFKDKNTKENDEE